ncbi:MAG TPA: YajQ family cyclic di-GMP-binding protein [Gammaproteobacteria bacterium]|nr:YajQ family cyclic di-GMP-binding protein [Gammaproteobacteria bacterium]
MPSFDVVSEVDMHEVSNAVDQANREIGTRFDFKGSNARIEHSDGEITLYADVDFQLNQMLDILKSKLARRGVDVASLEINDPELAFKEARQKLTVRQGLDSALGKDIVKRIKDTRLKVQTAIQGDKVRVSGKKKNDLQAVMALLREARLGLPLQFVNLRD